MWLATNGDIDAGVTARNPNGPTKLALLCWTEKAQNASVREEDLPVRVLSSINVLAAGSTKMIFSAHCKPGSEYIFSETHPHWDKCHGNGENLIPECV